MLVTKSLFQVPLHKVLKSLGVGRTHAYELPCQGMLEVRSSLPREGGGRGGRGGIGGSYSARQDDTFLVSLLADLQWYS